jgi:hypothetical protein
MDDASLYDWRKGIHLATNYLLVINAANMQDWDWLTDYKKRFKGLVIEDKTDEIAMIAIKVLVRSLKRFY